MAIPPIESGKERRSHGSHRTPANHFGCSVGTLLAGVVVGWMRSVQPWFFMKSVGLAAFVAMIGFKADQSSYTLSRNRLRPFWGGIVVTLTPLISDLFFDRYILRLNPLLLMGGLAGAQTMIHRRGSRAEEIRQLSGHARLFVHCSIRPHSPDHLGDSDCGTHDVRQGERQ